jgi:hypothetical protein
MITLNDCIAFLGLTEEEIDAIAEHEHVPAMIATELAAYMLESEDGERMIRRMIIDDIMHARRVGNDEHVETLTQVMKHFVATHPDRPR